MSIKPLKIQSPYVDEVLFLENMQCGKLFFACLVIVLLLGVAFVPEAEAHHHHRRGHGLPALLTAGIIAKVLEHQHHGCHHHHG
ncbi:hypothetical protein TNCV_2999681 [Trichonephila clavipes]|nr:hypothetical protein TNCV_2999681 [Trichonephila clavipes]